MCGKGVAMQTLSKDGKWDEDLLVLGNKMFKVLYCSSFDVELQTCLMVLCS